MKKNTVYLIIGLVLFLLGGYQNDLYENKGIEMEVRISDIETSCEDDDGPISYQHTYYADYTYGGKDYEHIRVARKYTNGQYPEDAVGDTVTVVLNPEKPNKKLSDGGIFITVGLIMIVWNSVVLIKERRKRKANNKQI